LLKLIQTNGDWSMAQRLVIIGAGFAGMYAALSAARLRDVSRVSVRDLEIALVAPEPKLVVRPRLYEPNPERLTAPLRDVLAAIEVGYVRGTVETIDTHGRHIEVVMPTERRRILPYDRLVLATGSRLYRPAIPGLADHGFSVDQLEDAIALDRHLHRLAGRPTSDRRNTVVIVGGGFTGIEVATEMPTRLRNILGQDAKIRAVVIERHAEIAHGMSVEARTVIQRALSDFGIETHLGVQVTELDETGLTLSDGARIESETVIWVGGLRAAPLTALIPGERDELGRLLVDRDLRAPKAPGVFAAGDACKAACDDLGNYTLMTGQHAARLGAFAGNNAVAELLGLPTRHYHQKTYVTCLDLGEAGALFTRGWNRTVELVGEEAKKLKRQINTIWIYPPPPTRAAALASADPERVIDL
jgi:NADH:ubiquinone reductase (H+-translocating)